jgi:hypothetical protein
VSPAPWAAREVRSRTAANGSGPWYKRATWLTRRPMRARRSASGHRNLNARSGWSGDQIRSQIGTGQRRRGSTRPSAPRASAARRRDTRRRIAVPGRRPLRLAILLLSRGVVHRASGAAGAASGVVRRRNGPRAQRATGSIIRACLYAWAIPRTMGRPGVDRKSDLSLGESGSSGGESHDVPTRDHRRNADRRVRGGRGPGLRAGNHRVGAGSG